MEFMHRLTQKNPETLKSLHDRFKDVFPEDDYPSPPQDGPEHVQVSLLLSPRRGFRLCRNRRLEEFDSDELAVDVLLKVKLGF